LPGRVKMILVNKVLDLSNHTFPLGWGTRLAKS
jgi:hypothetical protein